MKKNLATSRYLDDKIIPLRVPRGRLRVVEQTDADISASHTRLKRAVDIVFATAVAIFGFPFYMLIALLIKLTSEGPVLFIQDRIGQDGRRFRMYKFRTMRNGNSDKEHRTFAENFIKGNMNGSNGNGNGNGDGKSVFKITDDPRVTSIGRILRRTSLDELPQFLNVLKGEMSLVGPRPPLPYELDHYKAWHRKRLTARPGLTGLWQVSGRSTVPFDEMVMLDLYYIENRSLLLDLKIILRTIPVMFAGCGGY